MADKKSYMLPGAHMGADPEFFSAWTLYDLGPDNPGNLATIMNVIAGRGQPLLAGVECIDQQDLANGMFGEDFNGVHRVWCLKWIASSIGQMSEKTLTEESNNKEMQTGLHETAQLTGRIVTGGPGTNTFFIRHDSF